jgi:glucose-6-phosphate isomerase
MIRNHLLFNDTPDPDQLTHLYDRLRSEVDSGKVGYYHLPDNQNALLESITAYASRQWVSDVMKKIVIVGIGGSLLGTKAVYEMVGSKSSRKEILFLENVDPVAIESALSQLILDETLFLVVSKSGTTIETVSIAKHIMERFGLLQEPELLQRHIAVITDTGSPLEAFAQKRGMEVFNIPENVGGRFSVLSAVGLLPLHLAGFDVSALLEGAAALRKRLLEKRDAKLLQKAIYYNKEREAHSINILFCYGSSFDAFNRWYVQLWGESLGKLDDGNSHVGLTPVGLTGAVDQHSFLQLIMDGPPDKTVTFVRVDTFDSDLVIPDICLEGLQSTDYANGRRFEELINAECDATMRSIAEAGIPVDLLVMERLDEYHVGSLLFYYEVLTSLVGILEGVNTYDQPGVERGKKILRSTLEGSDG